MAPERAGGSVEFSPDAIVWTNEHGVVVRGNRTGSVLIGAAGQALNVLQLTDIVTEEHRDRVRAAVSAAGRGVNVEPIEVQLAFIGGQPIKALLTEMTGTSTTGTPGQVAWRFEPADHGWRGTPLRPVAEALFLAAYSRSVSESLDVETTYRSIVDRAVPFVADWCAIDLLHQGQMYLRRVAVGSCEPVESERVLTSWLRFPVTEESRHPVLEVVRTGQPMVISQVSDAEIRGMSRSDAQFVTIKRLGIRSLMIVPLRFAGQSAGAMTFALSTSGSHFTEADLPLAVEMAVLAQQAIENARTFQQAEEVSRIREHYLAVASHELRTPLAVVGGFAGLLLKQFEQNEPDRTRIELLSQELRRGISRLEALTEDLLLGASIQRANGSLSTEMVDLVALVQTVTERFNVAAEGQLDHRLNLVLPDELIGHWNPETLERAVSNLIANAIKYSPAGGDVTITLARRGEDRVVIQVSDQGMGISEDEIDRLFDPFERGSEARKMSDGTGLGLFITRQVVDQHGGTIMVQSAPGAGSTFTIMLPLRSGVEGIDGDARPAGNDSP